MRYITKLTLAFTSVMALALLCAGLAFRSAQMAERNVERGFLAHRVHEAYLSLSSHAYELFKQYGDALLIGDRDEGAGEARLLSELRADIREIRSLIGQEVSLVGTSEIDELDHLARIESVIEDLLSQLDRLKAPGGEVDVQLYSGTLVRILDQKIDVELAALIDEAIAEEAREVEAVQAEVRAGVARYRSAAVLAALAAAVATVLAVLVLRRSLVRPVEDLVVGAEAVTRGDLGHRIEPPGVVEFDRVAGAFNAMVSKVSERHETLDASRGQLELEVSRRTAEIEAMLGSLREAEANRRRMLTDVSHELRTPLTVIRGEAEVALRGGARSEGEYREVLARIGEAVEHTGAIVDDLLFIARQESGEARLRLAEIDLAATVSAAVAPYAERERGRRSVSVLEPVGEIAVHADPGRLRQVMSILLENAVLYGGARIEVSVERTAAGGGAVTVCDDGPGMSDVEIDSAFERFFRGKAAATRYDAGTGIGLPVARSILAAHGGSIELSRRTGDGTCARFELPGSAQRPQAAPAVGANNKGLRITSTGPQWTYS